LKYNGNGNFVYKNKPLPKKTKIGIVAGGSGLTPMFSVAQASSWAQDELEIRMIYSNKTKEDIMCENELKELQLMNPDHFRLFHTLTRHD